MAQGEGGVGPTPEPGPTAGTAGARRGDGGGDHSDSGAPDGGTTFLLGALQPESGPSAATLRLLEATSLTSWSPPCSLAHPPTEAAPRPGAQERGSARASRSGGPRARPALGRRVQSGLGGAQGELVGAKPRGGGAFSRSSGPRALWV